MEGKNMENKLCPFRKKIVPLAVGSEEEFMYCMRTQCMMYDYYSTYIDDQMQQVSYCKLGGLTR